MNFVPIFVRNVKLNCYNLCSQVLSTLVEAVHQKDPSHIIVLACDEDKKERDVAAKVGLRIVSGEWFMQSIVKQKIDFDTVVTSE